MVGEDDNDSIGNEESSTAIPVEADSKEVELFLSMPRVDFNSLRDDEVLDWWKIHK